MIKDVNGMYRVPVFRNCVDFDYASMYPNNSIQFNVDHETMVGAISMNNCDINYNNNNLFRFYQPSSQGTYINDLVYSDNYSAMCTDILNMPTMGTIYDRLIDKYTKEESKQTRSVPNDGKLVLMMKFKEEAVYERVTS